MSIIDDAEKWLGLHDDMISAVEPPDEKFREEWELEELERVSPQTIRLAIGYLRSLLEVVKPLKNAKVLFGNPEDESEWAEKFNQIAGETNGR